MSHGDEVIVALNKGIRERTVMATGMNKASSRSHALFVLDIVQRKEEDAPGGELSVMRSKLTLIDLAGSERAGAMNEGKRLTEGNSINKSLTTLGRCISSLIKRRTATKKIAIPFRESVLTWLLKVRILL